MDQPSQTSINTVYLGGKKYPVVWGEWNGQHVAGCRVDGFMAELTGYGFTHREAIENLKREFTVIIRSTSPV
jgi:hypothetical protein